MTRRPQLLLPYESLLLAIAVYRGEGTSRRVLEMALTAPGIDWPALVRMSIRHGLAQYAAYALADLDRDLSAGSTVEACAHPAVLYSYPDMAPDGAFTKYIPPGAAASLHRMYRGNAFRTRAQFREAARLIRALEAAGIPCIVLKGAALALAVYPDAPMRNFADIDILVRPHQLEDAGRIARSCGFISGASDWAPYEAQQRWIYTCTEDILSETLAPEFDKSFAPDKIRTYCHQVIIEIHRGIFRDPLGFWQDLDPEPLWEDLQAATFPDGTPLRFFSPEAMLVHLSVHGAQHAFQRLIYPLDIAQTIRRFRSAINWDRVAFLARYYQVRSEVYHALELVRREFGIPVPVEKLDWQPSRFALPSISLALPEIIHAVYAHPQEVAVRRWLLSERDLPSLASLLRWALPPISYVKHSCGSQGLSRMLLSYLVRPFRLAGLLFWLFSRIFLRSAVIDSGFSSQSSVISDQFDHPTITHPTNAYCHCELLLLADAENSGISAGELRYTGGLGQGSRGCGCAGFGSAAVWGSGQVE